MTILRCCLRSNSRMLNKSASFVLTSLRGSTHGKEYDSRLRSLRPCLGKARLMRQGWAGEKSGLFEHPAGYLDAVVDRVLVCVSWTLK